MTSWQSAHAFWMSYDILSSVSLGCYTHRKRHVSRMLYNLQFGFPETAIAGTKMDQQHTVSGKKMHHNDHMKKHK